MKSSEIQVNHINSTSPSFVLDDSLNVEGKYMCILRPNEELKPYYGEQPHKMISILILSFRYTFYVGLMNLMSSGILIVKRIILAIIYILTTYMKP